MPHWRFPFRPGATTLFCRATDMVRGEPTALAAAEAMQAAELLFATLLGALAIIVGIALFGWVSGRGAAGHDQQVRALRGDRGA